MPAPRNQSDVRSLLGMANFCGQRFIKNYATVTHNLRLLTKKESSWEWTEKHESSLDQLKKCQTEVYVDASPVWISAILMQKEANSEKRVNIH